MALLHVITPFCKQPVMQMAVCVHRSTAAPIWRSSKRVGGCAARRAWTAALPVACHASATTMSDIVLGSCKPPGERPITVTVSRVIDAPLAEVSRVLLGNWKWQWLDRCPQAGLAVLDVQQPTESTGEHAGIGVRAGAQRNLVRHALIDSAGEPWERRAQYTSDAPLRTDDDQRPRFRRMHGRNPRWRA
jgi:hypothetical protein